MPKKPMPKKTKEVTPAEAVRFLRNFAISADQEVGIAIAVLINHVVHVEQRVSLAKQAVNNLADVEFAVLGK